MMGKAVKDKISEAFANKEKITQALAKGVNEALLQHKKAGNPVASWCNGKITWIQAEDIIEDKKS